MSRTSEISPTFAVLVLVASLFLAPAVLAQETLIASTDPTGIPDAPDVQVSSSTVKLAGGDTQPAPAADGKQTKRILWIVPNFRAVSVDTRLPPLSPKDKLILATQDSLDYSAFIYVAMLAGVSQAQDSYPEFHQGAAGYARYYWHSFADNAVGNMMTEFIVPSLTREDPRYYTLGRGGFIKRTGYSISRLIVTRTDADTRSLNISEIVGNGAAAGISNLYYPSKERTWTKTGQKWILQIGLDGVSNAVKEFWPDINSAIFHNKH